MYNVFENKVLNFWQKVIYNNAKNKVLNFLEILCGGPLFFALL